MGCAGHAVPRAVVRFREALALNLRERDDRVDVQAALAGAPHPQVELAVLVAAVFGRETADVLKHTRAAGEVGRDEARRRVIAIDDAGASAFDLQRERRPQRARQPSGRRARPPRLDAPADAVDVRVRGERRRNRRHPVVPRPHVVVDERDNGRGGARDARVARAGRARPRLEDVSNPGVAGGVAADDSRRVVLRSVVDDEDLEQHVAALTSEIAQERIDRRRAFQRRHDHRDLHALTGAAAARAAGRRSTTTASPRRIARRDRRGRTTSPIAWRRAPPRRTETVALRRWSRPSADRGPAR